MGLFKCCVGGCNATSETNKLFSFSKNDKLRNLWMSFLVPTNSLLIGPSKEQLLRKRVCEKHFDRHQFDEKGKRLRYSYPCLFTDDEIAHGEPLSSAETVRNALCDHNYYKEETDEDDDVADTLLVIGRPGENFNDHPYSSCSYLQPDSSATGDQRDVISEQPSCSFTKEKEIEVLATSTHTDGSINVVGRDPSIFFDPPHLLKGLRNNFLNKNIIWEGKTASWKDIQFIYDLDSKLGHTRALPKLTAHHVNPDKIKKMKVSVAAQVFSARTAAMLKYTNALNNCHGNTSSMETTAEVVEFFDRLFDSVNCYPGGAAKGELRKAVKPNSPHQPFWTDAIKKIKTLKFEDASSKLAMQAGKPRLVRVPSLEGWITTLESFIRIRKLLFEKYGVEYFYPRFINQDPLENFFGRIRALNYRNINPDTNTFMHSYKSLLLSNFLSPHSKFANCEVDNGETLLDVNFLFEDALNENKCINIDSTPIASSSQERKYPSSPSGSIPRDQVILEKIKVQCSAYTAGYICRKMSKKIQCKSCKTYTSSSTGDNIYSYIKYREYKLLKNNNLAYSSSKLLIMYRDASTCIHNYLNENGFKKFVAKNLNSILNSCLRFSWLGCY